MSTPPAGGPPDDLAPSPELARRLRAAELLADRLHSEEDEGYRNLENHADLLPHPLQQVVSRSLLAIRRRTAPPERASSRRNQELTEDLRSGDEDERIRKAEELIDAEDFSAAPALVTRLAAEKSPRVGAVLARGVGILGGSSATVLLRAASRSKEKAFRLGAIEGLDWQTGAGAVRLLLDRLADEDEEVRAAARRALEARSPDALLEVLLQFPRDSEVAVVRAAVPVLARWSCQPGVQDLLQLFQVWDDPDLAQDVDLALRRGDLMKTDPPEEELPGTEAPARDSSNE